MKLHTIKNPLVLNDTPYGYKVNKPNQGKQELVSKEIAIELLNALILAQLQINMFKPNLNAEVKLLISKAIKNATG